MEKMWVTHNPYFRLVVTIFGMVLTDVWKAFLYSISNIKKENILGVRVFLDLLAEELLNNPEGSLEI